MLKYFELYTPSGTPEGFSYVRDFKGNLVYYGTLDECETFINQMEDETNG